MVRSMAVRDAGLVLLALAGADFQGVFRLTSVRLWCR